MSSTHHDVPTTTTRKKEPCGRPWVECECMYSASDMELRIKHGTGLRQRPSKTIEAKKTEEPKIVVPEKPTPQKRAEVRKRAEPKEQQPKPCAEHPKYGGVRSPRTSCTHCWAFYATLHPERVKAKKI